MERKLASIQRITDIQPIPGADKIEVATVLGWKVVVLKNEFKVNDLCIYCEIDSILPEKPEFEFLRDRRFRIKTIKLRGQLSQGICFPLSILRCDTFPVGTYYGNTPEGGEDVTSELGVKKYDLEEVLAAQEANGLHLGWNKRTFPSYVPRTDETRVQSCPKVIEEFGWNRVYITVKVDGTSCSIMRKGRDIDVCSRNQSKKDPHTKPSRLKTLWYKALIALGKKEYMKMLKIPKACDYWDAYYKYDFGKILAENDNIAIQGELAGPGIQKNRLHLPDKQLFVFNIYDILQGRYLSWNDVKAFCSFYGLQTVPVVAEDVEFNYDLPALLELAKGKYPNTNQNREGIVIRPMVECYSPALRSRLSVKVVNNDYLLKEEE